MSNKSCNLKDKDQGFTTAQFVVLMSITFLIFASFVNIFLIEYSRYAAQSSLYDAARIGTQSLDLERAMLSANDGDDQYINQATNACRMRLEKSVNDLIGDAKGDSVTLNCEIDINENGNYIMRASYDGKGLVLFPWAKPFETRLSGLSASYEQKQVAQ